MLLTDLEFVSLSKLIERLASKQFVTYLEDNKLLPKQQSGFRAYHSTETTVLKVVGDILHALDTGNIALLTLLDLSTAFDSVDHSVLLQRPQKLYGLHGTVIGWFASYLTLRSQYVRTPASKSTPSFVLYGVPQGSVLGPILFVLYVAEVLQLVKDHRLMPHAYADDTRCWIVHKWLLIGSFRTMTRQKHRGVHLYDGNIRSRRNLYLSEVHLCSQSPSSGILGSTSILMLPCALM